VGRDKPWKIFLSGLMMANPQLAALLSLQAWERLSRNCKRAVPRIDCPQLRLNGGLPYRTEQLGIKKSLISQGDYLIGDTNAPASRVMADFLQ
jgi:hypothetical protein